MFAFKSRFCHFAQTISDNGVHLTLNCHFAWIAIWQRAYELTKALHERTQTHMGRRAQSWQNMKLKPYDVLLFFQSFFFLTRNNDMKISLFVCFNFAQWYLFNCSASNESAYVYSYIYRVYGLLSIHSFICAFIQSLILLCIQFQPFRFLLIHRNPFIYSFMVNLDLVFLLTQFFEYFMSYALIFMPQQ